VLGPKDCHSVFSQDLAFCLVIEISITLGSEDNLHAHTEADGLTSNLAIQTILNKGKNALEAHRKGTSLARWEAGRQGFLEAAASELKPGK